MFSIQDSFRNDEFQLSVKRVFQSVGLARITTASDPRGFFASYQGEDTPSWIRKNTLHCRESNENLDHQTIGGNLIDVDMRANLKATKEIDDLEEENDDSSEYEDCDQSELPEIEVGQGTARNLGEDIRGDESEGEEDEIGDDEDNDED